MSIIWLESFDFYGTDMVAFSQRGYTTNGNVSGNFTVENNSLLARTGTGYFQFDGFASNRSVIRSLNSSELNDILGVGIAIFVSGDSSDSANNPGLRFGNITDFDAFSITYNGSNNSLSLWNFNAKIGATPPNSILKDVWYWLEVKTENDTVGGSLNSGKIEIKINGVTQLIALGLAIGYQFLNVSLGQAGRSGNGARTVRFDDWIIWNGVGTVNNDFLGDRRVVTLYPDADTIEADWSPSVGTEGFAVINEPTPDDVDFITANVAGDISEYEKGVISIDTNDIAAVAVVARMFKDNAGASEARIGVNSAASVSNSPVISPSVTPAYFTHIVERDPNGDIQWTRSAVDNALIRLTRET